MSSTYDYLIQGIACTDKRWDANPPEPGLTGVWFIRPEADALPSIPALRVTRFTRPGADGESQGQYAPLEPSTFRLPMRFEAVCTDPNHPRYQKLGETFDERMAFLTDNINEFFFRTQLGAQSGKGYVRVERVNNQHEHFPGAIRGSLGRQETNMRLATSSDPEMDSQARWADYEFLFDVPLPVWRTRFQEVEARGLTPNTTHTIEVPMGTAPVIDSLIAFKHTGEGPVPPGARFTNDQDLGFTIGRQLSSGEQWRLVDTYQRSLGGRQGFNTGQTPNWGMDVDNETILHDLGRPQGTSLRINPGVAGTGERVGVVKIRPNVPMDVLIRVNPAFF